MKTGTKCFLKVGVVLTIGVLWLAYYFLCPESSRNRAFALETTLEWGRLAPLPPSAQQFNLTRHGSIFTRGFRSSFVAPPEDIEEWLRTSSGTREAVVTTPSLGVRHFQIKPGAGAEFAEVTADDSQHTVSIHVYWS